MPGRSAFDKSYYDRFYRDPRTRVAEEDELTRLGAFVAAYLDHLGQPVGSVLDLGCGVGAWRTIAARHWPEASYTGVEISDYLCEEMGWEHGSVVDWVPDEPADLVVCHGVLQYLRAADARRAITNLARCSRGAVYVEALTTEDWERNCDRESTDGEVYLRAAAWYRREFGRRFANCGGGVLLSPRSPAIPWELEKAE